MESRLRIQDLVKLRIWIHIWSMCLMHDCTGNHGVAERLEQLAREAGKTMEEITLLEETAGSLFEKCYM
jgi:hypothetical protein